MRNEAWPIHVIHISPRCTLGKRGTTRSEMRFVKRDGINTSERKLRRCHAIPGLSVTRVEPWPSAPFSFVRRLLEKGIGTVGQRYNLLLVTQKLSAR